MTNRERILYDQRKNNLQVKYKQLMIKKRHLEAEMAKAKLKKDHDRIGPLAKDIARVEREIQEVLSHR